MRLLLASLLVLGACAPRVAPVTTIAEVASASGPGADAVAALATAAVSQRLAMDTVTRMEINEKFPNARAIRDRLANVGLPWAGDDDWFGAPQPAPGRWEVHIGAEVDVAVAQAVIGGVHLAGGGPFAVVFVPPDDLFGHERRVYVGALDIGERPAASLATLAALLEPGITAAELHQRATK